MVKRSSHKIPVDGYETMIFLSATSEEWGITVMEEAESAFLWRNFLDANEWLASKPRVHDFQSFHSVASGGEDQQCAVIIGFLNEGVLFGYAGIDGFWCGVLTHQTFELIWQSLADLARQLDIGG